MTKDDFIRSCKEELVQNNYKGDFSSWKPSSREILEELNWHVTKLNTAIITDNKKLIREYSCDVSNYCQKIFEIVEDFKGIPTALGIFKDDSRKVKRTSEKKHVSSY